MRAAMVLGIIGGVLGIIVGLSGIVFGVMGDQVSISTTELYVLGCATIFISVTAIIGGALSKKSPKASWIIMLATAILGFILISFLWIPSAILLLIASLLQFIARKNALKESPVSEPSA